MKFNNILHRIGGVLAGALLIPAMAWADSAQLKNLEVRADGQNLVEGFASATTAYSVQLDQPVTVTLSAVPESPTAKVAISVNSAAYTNHSVAPLAKGANTITCTVTDGSLSKSYVINVQAEEPHRTLYFKSGGWSAQPYVYIYSGSGEASTEYAGKWPGTTMTRENDAWYKFELPDAAGKEARVIFNTNTGADRYPADQEDGVKLDFDGYEGWYVLSEKKFYTSNPDGPQKPEITVTPAGGKVKGTGVITISFAYEPTEVAGTFNGRALSLSATATNIITVSDYLVDGATGTLTVTASNAIGEAEPFTATYTRDDSTPVVTLTGDQRELSIYQIMVGSFQHGEGGASGYTDMWGPEGHRKNGNLRGIINSLDYIKELGMNAIWMTPVFDSTNGSGGEKLQATGYFANDYFNIDPKFGTKAEFKELVDACHERGIYVILDGVFGHHGGSPKPSPSGKTIDNRTASNVRGSDAGNIAYPGSLDFFKEVVRYWMDEYGVDGWRLDQCYQVYQGGHNYWNDLRLEVEAVCAERKARGEQWGTLGYMVGEDWTGAASITVTQQDGLKSVMDFDGKDNFVGLGYGVGSIGWYLSNDAAGRGYRDAGVIPTLFLSNHDTSRVGDFQDISTESGLKQLMTRHAGVACYNGPTCTYYGDEIGDKSGNGNPDNKARTSGRLTGFNANEQALHDYVAKVFNIRKENPAMWRGTVSRQEGTGLEVITKTDAETGNTIKVIFSQTDRNVSIGGTGEDLINGGSVSGTVSVKAWVPAFIRMN